MRWVVLQECDTLVELALEEAGVGASSPEWAAVTRSVLPAHCLDLL